MYDSLLKGRIEIQKILTAANQLPQPDKWNEFIDSAGDEYNQRIKEGEDLSTRKIPICLFNTCGKFRVSDLRKELF